MGGVLEAAVPAHVRRWWALFDPAAVRQLLLRWPSAALRHCQGQDVRIIKKCNTTRAAFRIRCLEKGTSRLRSRCAQHPEAAGTLLVRASRSLCSVKARKSA